MILYTFKVVFRKGYNKDEYFHKAQAASNAEDAYELMRKEYRVSEYNLYIVREDEITAESHREKWFHAIASRSCPNCD